MKDNIFPLYTLNKISNSMCPHYNVQVRERPDESVCMCTRFAPKYLQKNKVTQSMASLK